MLISFTGRKTGKAYRQPVSYVQQGKTLLTPGGGKVMTATNPAVSAFVGVPKGPDGQLDRDRLETAIRYGFRIVRWHLEEEAAT
jgi:hypothetical protein